MARLRNLARMTTSTTGTGTITLGSAVSGFLSFAGADVTDGATVTYAITDGSNSEIGRGVYTSSGTTLTRSVIKSTNSDSAISLSGTAQVMITPAAEDFLIETNAQTGTTYTVLSSDLGKLVTLSNASAVAVTLPQATSAFGAGWYFRAQNKGAGTVTITPTTSTINGAATLTLTTGQGAHIVSDGTNYQVISGLGAVNSTSAAHTAGTIELGHASDTTLSRSAAGEVAVEGVPLKKAGKETIWIPAAAMVGRTTNGAASGTTETTTNKIMLRTLDFDATTQEFAQFAIRMPKSWNEGTVTFQAVGSRASGSNTGVVWGLAGGSYSSGDTLDTALGTAVTSAVTMTTANLVYISTVSSAITIAGSPAAEDWCVFQVNRTVSDGSDDMTADARLHGITLYITTDASTDA